MNIVRDTHCTLYKACMYMYNSFRYMYVWVNISNSVIIHCTFLSLYYLSFLPSLPPLFLFPLSLSSPSLSLPPLSFSLSHILSQDLIHLPPFITPIHTPCKKLDNAFHFPSSQPSTASVPNNTSNSSTLATTTVIMDSQVSVSLIHIQCYIPYSTLFSRSKNFVDL